MQTTRQPLRIGLWGMWRPKTGTQARIQHKNATNPLQNVRFQLSS
jgi:hypothetical protein